MKQSKIILAVAFILMGNFFCTIYSQEQWTLEKCINYALENNIQVKQQELDTKYRQNLLLQSKLDLLPSVNGNFDNSYTAGRALDQTTYQFSDNQTIFTSNLSANASLTVYNGFQKLNTIQENRFNMMASLKDLEKLKNDVSLNIAAAYLQIILNTELLDATQNQHGVTLQQVTRTEKLVQAGSLPRANFLEIQAQAASEEVQIANAQNQLDLSYLTLVQFLELDSIKGFEIVIPEIEIPEEDETVADIGGIFELSQGILPQIKSAEYRLSSAQKSLQVAKGGHSPRVSVTGTYYTGYSDARQQVASYGIPLPLENAGVTSGGESVTLFQPNPIMEPYPFWNQYSDNASTGISLNISIPIFNGWIVNSTVSNARISVLNSQYNLENSKKILYKEIQQAYADAKAAFKNYKASEKALLAMEESFNYTKQRYEVGLINTVDYNIAQNRLSTTKSDLLRSKYEYIFKTKILDFYQGKPITLTTN